MLNAPQRQKQKSFPANLLGPILWKKAAFARGRFFLYHWIAGEGAEDSFPTDPLAVSCDQTNAVRADRFQYICLLLPWLSGPHHREHALAAGF